MFYLKLNLAIKSTKSQKATLNLTLVKITKKGPFVSNPIHLDCDLERVINHGMA